MCEEYWQSIDFKSPVGSGAPLLHDVDLTVARRNGPRSWMCTIEHPRTLNSSNAVLRTAEGAAFTAGERIRVLAAIAEPDEDLDLLALTLTSASEVFRVKSS